MSVRPEFNKPRDKGGVCYELILPEEWSSRSKLRTPSDFMHELAVIKDQRRWQVCSCIVVCTLREEHIVACASMHSGLGTALIWTI